MKRFSIFFMDDKGAYSMMRLLSFLLVVSGIVFAFVHPDYETGYISIITLGLSGKVGQKFLEKTKDEGQDSNNSDSTTLS